MDDEILQVYLKVYGLETNNIIDIDIEFEIGEAFFISFNAPNVKRNCS